MLCNVAWVGSDTPDVNEEHRSRERKMKAKNGLDRSAMFSCLLDLSQVYGLLDTRDGSKVTTEALEAWYASPSTDMYDFTRNWITTEQTWLLPLR